MKRKFLSALLALVMILSLAVPAMAAPDLSPDLEYDVEETESNSTFAEAQPIELGQTYSGQAWLNRDVDLFRLTLDEAKEIRLTAFVDDDPINPIEIVLFDADGNMLVKAVHVGTGSNTNLQEYLIYPTALEADTYYVGICVTGKLNGAQSISQSYYFVVNEGVYPCEGYHSAFFGHVITPATCVSDGEKLMTCPCGATETEIIPADPDAHTWSTTVLTAPTCTEEGAAHRVCTGCGLEEDLVLMSNHDALWEEETLSTEFASAHRVILQEPTADDYGFYEVYCDDCGALIWEESPISPLDHSFIDVEAGSFYDVPVAWAVYKEITNGIDSFRFGPNGQCLRAQVVTFLWRAEGCPEPTSAENPFVDVKESDFYYKAVLWAVENGITNGSDATHFNPMGVCNRAQVVTFLHRAKGSPAPRSMELAFTDVPADEWYAAPVAWAVENGITNGLSATEFGPDAACNRAQVVTFLYRAATMPEPDPETTYTFNLVSNDPDEEIGFVYIEGTEYKAGDAVRFYAEPWFGYEVEFTAEPEIEGLELRYLGLHTYELTMPAQDLTIHADFAPIDGSWHTITTNCTNGEAFAICEMDDDWNDVAKPGEHIIFYIYPDEGHVLTAENVRAVADGVEVEQFWFLGEFVDEYPEADYIDRYYMCELVMPDADVTVTIDCTKGADASAAQHRMIASFK